MHVLIWMYWEQTKMPFWDFGKCEGNWGICEHVFKKGHFVVSTENGGRVMGLVKLFFSKTVIVMKVWKNGL